MSTHLNARIAILGSGPAGIATAQYLKEAGYTDVLVLEKLGRVGGLCKSITDGYASFDLGANYFTPAYKEVIRFAKMVGAESYESKEFKILMLHDQPLPNGKLWEYVDVADYVMKDEQENPIGYLKMRNGVKKFLNEWDAVAEHVGSATYKTVHTEPSLQMTFSAWLDSKDLGFMKRMFEISMPMMGYGLLDEIAAPYALKYMEPETFKTLVRNFLILKKKRRTKRFTLGFQRVFERLSWGLNVRTNVTVTKIERNVGGKRPVKITLHHPERLFNDYQKHNITLYFDKLVVACPLLPDVLFDGGAGMNATQTEKELFSKVNTYSYCQTTLHAVEESVDAGGREVPFKLPTPVVPVMPFNRDSFDRPWALVQVWEDDSRMMQIYSRLNKTPQDPASPYDLFNLVDGELDQKSDRARTEWEAVLGHLLFDETKEFDQIIPRANALNSLLDTETLDLRAVLQMVRKIRDGVEVLDEHRDKIVKRAEELLEMIGGKVAGEASGDVALKRWRTYHEWPYFGNLPLEEISDGFFKKLDDIQGDNDTYYAGGATTFELVEAVVRSAKYAAERVDVDLQAEAAAGRQFFI